MEPAGTPPPPAAPPGVLAAQDAIVFSGTGAEGVTPPAMAPGGTDVFWASLVQAQLCVWELQGAIEGTPDGSDREPSAQGGWHHGDTVGSASTARSVSPKFMTTQGIISQENTPTDGNISPKFIPMEGNISPKFMPMEGNVSPKFMPMDGNISPKFMPMEGNISPKFMPTDGDISHEHYGLVPTDENISPRSMSTGGSISPVSVLMDGTISPKFTPMDEAISQENMPMDRSITPKFMPTDRTVSPKFMPTGGNTSPEHQAPERSKDDDGNGDDDDDGDGDDNDDGDGDDDGDDHDNGCSSREEDAEEDLDLEEEEPQFHTNPLFQSRVLPPMGAQWVPLYRPHCPPLLTEGDNAMEGCPTPPRDPSPLGCHPARGDIGSTTEQGPPRPPGLALSDTPDLPPGSGDPPHPLRLQSEWGYQDPPAPLISSECILGGGDRDPPSPGYPPAVTSGGGDQDLPLPRPPTPPKLPLVGGYQPPNKPMPPADLTQGRGDQTPPNPPDLPQKGGYQPPTRSMAPPDLTQGGGYQTPPTPQDFPQRGEYQPPNRPVTPPDLPQGGGYQPHNRPIAPPDLPQGGGYQPHNRPIAPPDLPQGGGYQPPNKPMPPADLTQGGGDQTPPNPPDLPRKGGYQPPTRSMAPPDLTQGGGYQTPPTPQDFPQRGEYQPPNRPVTPPDLPQGGGYQPHNKPMPPADLTQGGGDQTLPNPPDLPQKGGYQPPTRSVAPLDLPQRGGYQPPAKHLPPKNLPQGGRYQTPPTPPDLPQRGGYQLLCKHLPPPDSPQGRGYQIPPNPPDLPQRGGYQPPPKHLPPPDLPQGGGYESSPTSPDLPQRGGFQPPLNLQPPPSPPYQPMGRGYQPPPTSLPPPIHPQTPSPLSSLPPRGPPRPRVTGGSRGDPPMLGAHGCAWLLASPGASCPGGEVAQGPPPSTLPPHPVMEELPPETGEEPPPDPPTSTHGNPPGGSAVTPALANGGQGGQGRRGEAQRLAARLFHLNGFKRSQVAAFLRKNNDFSGMVAQEYLDFFQFEGQTLDQALRSFLQALVLTGETQERERILGHFSRRYHRCNPGAFPSPDAVHSLTCAIMLLNTDLHGQRLGRAMTSSEFVANLSGMMDGQDFPREQLKALYSSIRSEKLAWAADEEEEEEVGGAGSLAPPGCKKSNPSVELAGGPGAVTYRQGWLARKVLAEADGKKTPWGRRGWKPFHAVLKGTVLYFLKPGGRMGVPRRPPEPGPFLTPQEEGGPEAEEPLGVHHALAERASKYTKRPNVFRLQTADWRVFLFQAPTPEEMFSWISRINLVAALFSSPPFPAAVGSQRRFVRPILPAAPSRSAPEEQHRSHEAWMERVAQELFEHQRNLPEKRGRARDLDEYRLKKEYLLYERRRYETYVQVLETWIGAGARDLEGWEAQAGPEVAPPDPPTLTKAHSSPSLVPEPPLVPTIRVKRNISERRTVRKIVPKRNKNLL